MSGSKGGYPAKHSKILLSCGLTGAHSPLSSKNQNSPPITSCLKPIRYVLNDRRGGQCHSLRASLRSVVVTSCIILMRSGLNFDRQSLGSTALQNVIYINSGGWVCPVGRESPSCWEPNHQGYSFRTDHEI